MTEYLKLNEIAERYKVSKRTVERLIENDGFPKGAQFSPQVRLWELSDIESWFAEKNTETRKDLLTE